MRASKACATRSRHSRLRTTQAAASEAVATRALRSVITSGGERRSVAQLVVAREGVPKRILPLNGPKT